MNLVSLLVLPAIIKWEPFGGENGNAVRYVVAAAAALVLIAAIAYSSRKTEGITVSTHRWRHPLPAADSAPTALARQQERRAC